jgi:hypothetical protein
MSCDKSSYCTAVVDLASYSSLAVEPDDHRAVRIIPDSTETVPEYVWGDEGPINDFRPRSASHHHSRRSSPMKWITREHVKVDRVACPWLIKKFVDKDAEFIFVPPDKIMDEVKRLGAIPYDVKDVELGHHGKECSFEAILKKYKLTGDLALVLLGKIVNGADTDNTLYHQPEGPGLEAIADGFRRLGYKDDHALNAAEWIVYDALYAHCQEGQD